MPKAKPKKSLPSAVSGELIIRVNQNGYAVIDKSRGNYGNDPTGLTQSWSFHTLAELMKRLPYILDVPVEQRSGV